jgi:hypothetical protein
MPIQSTQKMVRAEIQKSSSSSPVGRAMNCLKRSRMMLPRQNHGPGAAVICDVVNAGPFMPPTAKEGPCSHASWLPSHHTRKRKSPAEAVPSFLTMDRRVKGPTLTCDLTLAPGVFRSNGFGHMAKPPKLDDPQVLAALLQEDEKKISDGPKERT